MLRNVPIRKRLRRQLGGAQAGLTLLELILTCAILLILSTVALPIARYAAVREREAVLHHNLDEIRDAIDRYKDAADHNQIKVEMGSEGYPAAQHLSDRTAAVVRLPLQLAGHPRSCQTGIRAW